MYFVYLLQDTQGKLYIGRSHDLTRRLREHKSGKVYTTRRMGEFEIVYYEGYSSEALAKERELKLKNYGSSYHGLLKRLHLK